MIGVRENNFHPEVFRQIALFQALDRSLRAHRHENWRLTGPVRSMQQPGSRVGMRTFRHNLEGEGPVQVRL